MKRFTVTEPYIKCSTIIGESIYYEPASNVLSFLDCGKDELHTVNLSEGPSSHKVIPNLAVKPHKLVDLTNSDRLWLCTGKHGFGLMDKETGNSKYIAEFFADRAQSEGFIANDAAVDSKGRFWAGTLSDPMDFKNFDGSIWRLDPDLTVHQVVKGGQGIPNGISWSSDDKTMFYADSTKGAIFAFDFDADAGSITNQRVFYKPDKGLPDGHAVDEEGCIWTALFGGSKVVRLSPKGEVMAEITMPIANITDVAFVGEELFISCAYNKNAESKEMEGNLFRCHVGVKGAPLNKFPLSKEFLACGEAKL